MSIPIKIIWGYYLLASIVLFLAMGIDKYRAIKHAWRIPEKTLFTLSLLGGAFGGFAGMRVFHHKNQKPIFHVIFAFSIVLHGAFLCFILGKPF